ncbi:hypothetical protein KA082_01785 [Candidatus Woesebacteria bacterium]|nr:hypothetical protein [Candidatus Woesebacteria bacterium]
MTIPSLMTSNGVGSLLALDQVVSIADHLGLSTHVAEEKAVLIQMIEQMATVYGMAGVSAAILSPELGYSALDSLPVETGVGFSLERRLYDADPLSMPILFSPWGVEAIRNNYGVAKLELFYNPEEKEAHNKKQMVAELYDYCKHEGIDFLLELVLYIEGSPKDYEARFLELQLAAIQELRASCSLLALEYPLSPLGAVTVTAQLDIPWILTARDTPYDVFKENLRSSLESGAKGYYGIEQFLPPKPTSGAAQFDKEKMLQFITTTGRDRALELSRIVSEME